DQDVNLVSDVFLLDRDTRGIERLSADADGGWMESSASPGSTPRDAWSCSRRTIRPTSTITGTLSISSCGGPAIWRTLFETSGIPYRLNTWPVGSIPTARCNANRVSSRLALAFHVRHGECARCARPRRPRR